MEHTQSQYEEAVKDYGIIDDLNVAIKKLIEEAKDKLGGSRFEIHDDLEDWVYDLTVEALGERVSEMRKIFKNGNPIYQMVSYINEHGGAYDC